MNWEETKSFLIPCFPSEVQDELSLLMPGELQEIRIRAGKQCVFRTSSRTKALNWQPTPREVEIVAEALCGHSLYARREEVRQGFVTLMGGHRLGLCGSVVMRAGEPHSLASPASLCLRIAGQWPGAAEPVYPLLCERNRVSNMLIIGPCASGKTTFLRDIARMLGDACIQTAVIDERGEIAACVSGTPQLDVGKATDVIDGCPKPYAVNWLIRSMNPQVIITDELASTQDVAAVLDAMACGCSVVASVHGTSLTDLASRPVMASMMARRIIDYFVVLSGEGCGQIIAVHDKNGSSAGWCG